jgi:tetratricopeptide (TPR) repeat protein
MDRVRQARQTALADDVLLAETALAFFGYHESRRRWQEMRELGTGAVELAQRHDRPATAAWLQHDSAIPEAESGDPGTAILRIQVALEMFRTIDDLFGQARCCSSLAYLLGLEGRIDEALEFGREALTLSRTIQDKTLEGVSLTAIGGLYDRVGDFERADAAFADGIALAEQANDTRAIFKRYVNSGFAHLQVGRYEDAVKMAQQALEVVVRAGDATFQAESHHLLAVAYAAQGQYDTAVSHLDSGLRVAQIARDVSREGRLYIELARVNAARGRGTTAIEQLNTALRLLQNASEVYFADARELLEKLDHGEIVDYYFTSYSM